MRLGFHAIGLTSGIVLEVFAKGRQALAVRVYPVREDSLGVSLRAPGKTARLNSLGAWQMKSIYA